MASKSGEKGKRFERDIKEMLNKAYNTEEFTRTPGSGALMGQSNFRKNLGLEDSTKRVLGSDMICPDWFRFSIECKNYNDSPNYAAIIKTSDTKLDYWLAETLFDSINLKQTPMLFFRTTRKGTHVAFPRQFFDIQPKYSVNYDCFTIMGVEHFEQFKQDFVTQNDLKFDDIQQWLNTSPQVSYYLEHMLKQLSTGKKDNKNQAKIEAVQFLMNSRNNNAVQETLY